MRPCLTRRRHFSLGGPAGATTLSPKLKRGLLSARDLVKGDYSEVEKVVDVCQLEWLPGDSAREEERHRLSPPQATLQDSCSSVASG